MKYELVWEKWKSPFLPEITTTDILESAPAPAKPYRDSYSGGIDTDEDDSDSAVNSPLQAPQPIPFMATSLGVLPLMEQFRPEKVYNFWTGHTNFNISQGVCKVIEDTDGVEILDVFTRYRFRVSIGHCFEGTEVKAEIQKNVKKYLETRKKRP